MRTSWALVLCALLVLMTLVGVLGFFVLDQAASTIGLLAAELGEVGARQQQAFDTLARHARLAIVCALVTALLIAVAAFWGVIAKILHPLQKLVASFDAMAYGNLSVPLEHFGRNELGQLRNAVRALQHRLSQTIALVRLSSEAVHRGTQHIASGNNDYSTRTRQQVAKLKKTASQIAELSALVKQHAEDSRQARQVTESAARTASGSSETVGALVSSMREGSQDARQITEAVERIENIASQANRIALLASVEAAQAGKDGQGFRIVAAEVMGLSRHSSDTAQAIRALIETMAGTFDSSIEQADRARRSIEATVCAVDHLNNLMEGLTSGSRGQSRNIEQINRAIAQIDQATQRDADLVQQDANAAIQLEAEARRLRKAVSVFKLAPEVERHFAANRYEKAADWMQTLTPEDLAQVSRANAKRRRAA